MDLEIKKTGIVRNIKFLIEDASTVKIWKPIELEIYDFKPHCNYVVKYLIDEGFLKTKKCRVNIVV